MDHVFVYGTLKRGFPYHDMGLAGQRFVARCRTCEPYPLVVADRWYLPILIAEPGVGQCVIGELYAVDRPTLAKLDRLEGTGLKRGYRRTVIAVQPLDRDTAWDAWAYVKDRALVRTIHDGPLAEYRLDSRYVPASDRKG